MMYKILYNGEQVYRKGKELTDLSYDEVFDIIEEISSHYFNDELNDLTKIEIGHEKTRVI